MKLVVYVMNKTEYLDEFLRELKEHHINGATIIKSTGMVRKLIQSDDMEFIGSLKTLFENPRQESHVILIATEEEKVKTVFQLIDDVCGGLDGPNSGIAFTLSIEEIKGCNF